jgi:uncharacterized membrane protein
MISILLKGINGALEILGGILLLIISGQTIINFVEVATFVEIITEGEVIQVPKNIASNFLLNLAYSVALNKYFTIIFLLSHGIIKLFLIICLLKKKLWSYPLAIFVFVLFIVYQTYQYYLSPSYLMILLNIFDVFVIALTYIEYRALKGLSTN